jgi:nicotinate-nucleotide pyrophosphorylase (carboxylating)
MIDPHLLALWLAEDLGDGDITTAALISESQRAEARIVAKQNGVSCGLDSMSDIARALNFKLEQEVFFGDGQLIKKGDVIARFTASYAGLLKAERTYLNLVQHLCGVATSTHRYAQAVAHTRAKILDTRKTIPGLRLLDKRAVRAGGGVNHRMGLYDAFLIKENHVEAFRRLPNPFVSAIETARRLHQDRPVIIEVQNLQECEQALEGLPDVILLDNMSCEAMGQAVHLTEAQKLPVQLEASGGITLETLVAVAETGVHRISIGAITHSAMPLDLSMLVQVE